MGEGAAGHHHHVHVTSGLLAAAVAAKSAAVQALCGCLWRHARKACQLLRGHLQHVCCGRLYLLLFRLKGLPRLKGFKAVPTN